MLWFHSPHSPINHLSLLSLTYSIQLRGLRGTSKIVECQVPPTIDALLHFKKEFSKCGVLVQKIFSKNFLKFSNKISGIFSKSKKSLSYKSSQFEISILIKIWPNSLVKLRKLSVFFLKTFIFFKIFGAFGAEDVKFQVPSGPDFCGVGVPSVYAECPPTYDIGYH